MTQYSPHPWHQKHFQRLQDTLSQGHLPHAILFSGPAGTGKLHLANCLVHRVLSENSETDNFETLLRAGTHPDVMSVSMIEDKKQISVDQIRRVSERVSLTPQLSHIKIVVIFPAELMTISAANALLKTLEEPSGNALIILVTHNYGSLAPTIRSRCQHIALNTPDREEAGKWLQEQGINDYLEYLEISSGAPLAAVSAAKKDLLTEYRQFIEDLTGLSARSTEMVSVAGKWRDQDMQLILGWIQGLVTALIKAHIRGETTSIISANFLKSLKISLDRINLAKLIGYSDYLDKARLEINHNLNRELNLEQIFMRWTSVINPA